MGRYSLDYVCHHYGVPAKRGIRVTCDGKPDTLTCGCGAHIRVRLDGDNRSEKWHPTWRVTY